MTGKWNRPLSALSEDIQRAAGALADAKCDIIVFHCTGHAMEEGPDGDARTRELIKSATGIEAMLDGLRHRGGARRLEAEAADPAHAL